MAEVSDFANVLAGAASLVTRGHAAFRPSVLRDYDISATLEHVLP